MFRARTRVRELKRRQPAEGGIRKWIYTEPRILILDEPTRGVDIGAKKEIYSIINQLAEKGVAIIMVSSELPEVLGMSDRIMVVREGMVRESSIRVRLTRRR